LTVDVRTRRFYMFTLHRIGNTWLHLLLLPLALAGCFNLIALEVQNPEFRSPGPSDLYSSVATIHGVTIEASGFVEDRGETVFRISLSIAQYDSAVYKPGATVLLDRSGNVNPITDIKLVGIRDSGGGVTATPSGNFYVIPRDGSVSMRFKCRMPIDKATVQTVSSCLPWELQLGAVSCYPGPRSVDLGSVKFGSASRVMYR